MIHLQYLQFLTTASINEGATAPANTAKFVVTQTPGSGKAVSINYTFDDVNAIAGSDYSITIANPTPADDGNTGILTFPASDNPAATVTMDVEFTVLPDELDEHDETFTVTLANPTPSSDGTIQTTNNNHIGTATITDDDAMPELTIADASGVEGSTDTDKLLKFTPTLSAVSGREVMVTYSTAPSGAFPVDTNDYTPVSSTIPIPAGQTTPVDQDGNPQSIVITTADDNDSEADETFTLTFGADYAGTTGGTTAIGTVLSNDTPVFTVVGMSITEGNDNSVDKELIFDVAISSGATESEKVDYATSDGPAQSGGAVAKAGSDYTLTSGTLEFLTSGSKTQQVRVQISGDPLYELNESFTLTLTANDSNTATATEILVSSAVGTIENDDPFLASTIAVVAKNNGRVTEGNAVEFEFTADPELAEDLVVNISHVQVGEFLMDIPGNTITIPANTSLTNKHLATFRTNSANTDFEADGSVALTIGSYVQSDPSDVVKYTPDGTNGNAIVQIEDANTPTGVSVIAISTEVTEGDMAKFEIKSDSTSNEARSVNINVDDGTADFIASSDAGDRSIEIPANNRAYILEVPITEDSDPEQHGTITVTIAAPTAGAAFAYTISTYNFATVSVYDDDAPTGISIAAVSSPVAEAPNTYAEFQIIADSKDETNDRTIEVRVENDTGDDFIDIANQDASYNYDTSDNIFDVTIPAGERFGLLRVKIHDDSKYESDGAITATIVTTPAPSHNSASIAIENDDLDVPIISIATDAETTGVTEGYEFTFEVESDRDLNGTALEITFDLTDGGTGATITGTSVMIPGDARVAIGTVTMPTADVTNSGANIEIEVVETAIYDVSTSDPSITVVVKDNDAPSSTSPRMSISSANYVADGEKIEFTITATDIPDSATDVKVMLGGDVNFLADGQAQTIDDITLDGVQEKTFEVDTKAGSAASNHGIITATILEGSDYVRPNTSAENETSIVVVDDLPVISISEIANVDKSLGDESNPSGTITFTLTSDIQAIAGYPINITTLSVDDTNATGPQYYVSHDPSTNIEITNLSTNNAEEISVTLTADNTIYQGWGELEVLLTDGADYTANTSADTRNVTIIDDQTAPVTVSVSARGSNVEGTDLVVTFEATGTFPAGGSIEVMPTISETGAVTGYYSGHSPTSVRLSANNRTSTITATSPNNSNTQANGEVTISIARGDGFEVHATDHTKVVMMLDDESLPKVSVSAIDTSIDEGQDAIFEFSATGTLTSPLEIDVSVDDGTGNFLTTTYARTTETIPTTGSISIPYGTDADNIEETNGTITVAVLDDDRDIIQYLVDPVTNRSSATLSVIDNDDSSLPSVTISAVQSSIIEGDIAIITLTTADDFTAPLTVLVEFVETNPGTGDFFGEALDPNKFTLPQRLELHETTKSINYHLPTKRDALTEDAGTITARIKTDDLPTKTYSVGANHSVSISVADDDIAGLPSLAIAVKDNQTSFTEGGPDPVFTITSTGGTDGETMNVDIRILQEGNFLQTPNELKSPLFTVGTPLDVAVAIANDDIDEPDGTVSATLQIKEPQEYSIGTNYQAIANISDDEETPEISISTAMSQRLQREQIRTQQIQNLYLQCYP